MMQRPELTGEPPKKKVKVSFNVVRTLTIDVLSSDSIESIKDKIFRIEGTSTDQQELFFAGGRLEDTKALSDYIVSTDSDCTIDVRVEGRIPIFINIPSMVHTIPFSMKYGETVQDLKVMIQDEVRIPADQQLLIHCGKTLNDDQLLTSCGIIKDSTVYSMWNPSAELLLYVDMACDNVFNIEVKAGYNISDVKAIIESLRGIPASEIRLFHDKIELMDRFTISFYKIKHQSILHLQAPIQIFVKIMNGNTISITTKATETISIIITKIASMTGYKCKNLKLMYDGKLLQGQNTLDFYGIKRESTVYLR